MIGIRRATDDDRVAIARLHEAAIRALGPACYTAEEVDSWAAGVAPHRSPDEDVQRLRTGGPRSEIRLLSEAGQAEARPHIG